MGALWALGNANLSPSSRLSLTVDRSGGLQGMKGPLATGVPPRGSEIHWSFC